MKYKAPSYYTTPSGHIIKVVKVKKRHQYDFSPKRCTYYIWNYEECEWRPSGYEIGGVQRDWTALNGFSGI